jgi:heme/copper-type cytochrome/quinol oxidase subunit 4
VERAILDAILRKGLWVFIVLAILTAGEYVLAVTMEKGNLPYMVVMNIVDAALILYFFMHVAQLWGKEE